MKGTAKILREGRITIPAPIRQELQLEHGDFVVIDVQPVDGE